MDKGDPLPGSESVEKLKYVLKSLLVPALIDRIDPASTTLL